MRGERIIAAETGGAIFENVFVVVNGQMLDFQYLPWQSDYRWLVTNFKGKGNWHTYANIAAYSAR